jgi:hypothetical protein
MGAHDAEIGPGEQRPAVKAGLRLVLCGALIVVVQGLFWLGQGSWTPFNLREILSALGMSHGFVPWPGAQAILDWTMAFPLGALAILIGSAIAVIGVRSPPEAGESARAR